MSFFFDFIEERARWIYLFISEVSLEDMDFLKNPGPFDRVVEDNVNREMPIKKIRNRIANFIVLILNWHIIST